MIDLHAHLLPGIDDGPADAEGAMAMARAAVAAGVTAMAATPHIDHQHGVDVGGLASRRAAIQDRLDAEGVALRVLQGGELTASRLMELGSEDLGALTLGGGRHLLLECPFVPAGSMFDHVVFRAQSLGFEVLLAHPERSPDFMGDVARVRTLVERRAHVQVTAGSLGGSFGRTVQRAAIALLEAGLVHVISSDAHDALRRGPDVGAALEAAAGIVPELREHEAYWLEQAPAAIVEGRELEPPPAPRVRRSKLLAARLRRRATG